MAKVKEEKVVQHKAVEPIVLGKTVFEVAGVLRLREITEDEALIEFANHGHESKIINAWKRANGKK
jgi:hypothetical protein